MSTFTSNLIPCDGELYLVRQFYNPKESTQLLATLSNELLWQQEFISIYGKSIEVPRLVCWYGDNESIYRYSGIVHEPIPWHPILQEIMKKLERFCHCSFNSMLANLYRNGNDSMGFHADDEKELGINPVIASLSFGSNRTFTLRHKKKQQKLKIQLGHGDLLVMTGSLQHNWQHAVPKTKKVIPPRINLTFRKIIHI